MGTRRWDRVLNIYELTERMRYAELGRAQVTLRETEETEACRRDEVLAARAVNRAGDGVEWAMAQASGEYALREMKRMAQVREMRAGELLAAEREHRASLVQMEQMKVVRESAESMHRKVEERRTQGVSDDRFAARLWRRVVPERQT